MKRILLPSRNPAGLTSAAAALYAVAQALLNAFAYHQAAVSPAVYVAVIGAFLTALTRQVVTPVADPRDGNGRPLGPAVPPAAGDHGQP